MFQMTEGWQTPSQTEQHMIRSFARSLLAPTAFFVVRHIMLGPSTDRFTYHIHWQLVETIILRLGSPALIFRVQSCLSFTNVLSIFPNISGAMSGAIGLEIFR